MTREWSVSAARASLPEILRAVAAGEEVVLTRHATPVAVIVRPDALRARRAQPAIARAADLRDRLTEAAGWPTPPAGGLEADRADELAAAVRADRDR